MVDRLNFNIKKIDYRGLRRRSLSSVPVLLIAGAVVLGNSPIVREVSLGWLTLTALVNAAFVFTLTLLVANEVANIGGGAQRTRYLLVGFAVGAGVVSVAVTIFFNEQVGIVTLSSSAVVVSVWLGLMLILRLRGGQVSRLMLTAGFFLVISMAHFFGYSYLDDGFSWMVLLILGTFTSDTSAYMVGSLWGRNKLIPSVSPNKTWEGFWGSLFFTALVTWVLGVFVLPLSIEFVPAFLLGIGIALSSTVGDLAQSKLKRVFGVKNSGEILPGHGGVFDRVDALLLNAIVLFWLAVWIS